MLMLCPECQLQVSDKALSCPHCGYPLKHTETPPPTTRKSSRKRRRLPNGFGQISEIKGRNLRKPFRAMVTIGKDENGRPISKPLKPESYFETYNDAYAALVEYNRNPYDISQDITVRELYERWSPSYFTTDNKKYSAELAWQYCSSVYDMKVADLKARHIKGCIEEGTRIYNGEVVKPSVTSQSYIKVVFNKMLDYALEYDLVDKNYARTFSLPKEISKELTTPKKKHFAYSVEELSSLWTAVRTSDAVDFMLIQCYAGWRPRELLELKIADVNIAEWAFSGGNKTEAGRGRLVPIHTKIRDIVKTHFDRAKEEGSETLFFSRDTDGTPKPYPNASFRLAYDSVIENLKLNPEHRPHDGRVTFVTNAKKCKVDEFVIKKLVGHKIQDITEKVYTDRDFEWLREELEKIK